MRTLDIVAAAVLAWGMRGILQSIRASAVRRDRREALQTWETEGGAVPVSPSTTAAQVSPPPDTVLSS